MVDRGERGRHRISGLWASGLRHQESVADGPALWRPGCRGVRRTAPRPDLQPESPRRRDDGRYPQDRRQAVQVPRRANGYRGRNSSSRTPGQPSWPSPPAMRRSRQSVRARRTAERKRSTSPSAITTAAVNENAPPRAVCAGRGHDHAGYFFLPWVLSGILVSWVFAGQGRWARASGGRRWSLLATVEQRRTAQGRPRQRPARRPTS
jgi:hypothetical protein